MKNTNNIKGIFIFLAVCLPLLLAAQQSNVAKGKSAKQSSDGFGGFASRAIDGTTSGIWGGTNSALTHTSTENNPWWEVDLGGVFDISEIKIWNRTDACCWNRLQNFYVMVSENPMVANSTTSIQFAPGPLSFTSAGENNKSLTGNARGQYVRIFIQGNNKVLTLAEVEVFGVPIGATMPSNAAASLDEYFNSHGGESKFNAQYIDVLSAMINAEDDVKKGSYAQAKKRLDKIWASYPIGDKVWYQAGNKVENTNPGYPVAYNSLLMLKEIVDFQLNKGSAPIKSNKVNMRVVLVGCVDGIKPSTLAELKAGKGKEVRSTSIDNRLKEDNYRIIKQSLEIFSRYVTAITDGKLEVDVKFLELPQVCLTATVNEKNAKIIEYKPVWDAPATKEVFDETDWWLILYPSQVPEDDPNAAQKIGFDNYVYVTGGMTGDGKGGPVFVIDDKWLIRKPAHMGKGLYSDIERRAYLPQWFQHEFFHHLYNVYKTLKLEPTSHDWFDRNFWPKDFNGVFEADYYAESLHKRIQKANPPLHISLRTRGPSEEDFNRLKIEDIMGSYKREPVQNDWHEAQIIQEGGKFYWKNKAVPKWEITPMISKGILKNDSNKFYPGQDYFIQLKRDANGNYTIFEGLKFQQSLYKRF